jgi:hypothetical protein
MSDRSKRPKDTLQADLSDQAGLLRQPKNTRQNVDRTTLNIDEPDDQGGAVAPPDVLGEALVDKGLISRHELFNALNESYARDCTLREALLQLELVDEALLKREGL